MRSFIIAAIILFLILLIIVLNSLYISDRIDRLLSICEELENNSSAESVELLLSEWRSCKEIISLSVHEREIERAENALLSLSTSRDIPSEFSFQLSVLKSALRSIGNGSRVSLDKIF